MKRLIPSSFLRTFAKSREQSSHTKPHKRTARVRFSILAILAVFFTSSIAQVLTPAAAYAATLNDKSLLGDQALAYVTYNAMVDCLGQEQQQSETNGFLVGINLRTNEAHMKSGDWWRTDGNAYWGTTQGAESAGSYLNSKVRTNSGGVLCNDIVKLAPSVFGYGSIIEFACSFIKFRANNSSCTTGTGDFGGLAITIDNFKSVMLKKAWPDHASLTLSSGDNDAAVYLLYRQAFLLGCEPKESASPASEFAYTNIRIIDDKGTETKKTYEGVNRGDTRQVYRSSPGTTETKNCGEIAAKLNSLADKFLAFKAAHPADKENTSSTDIPPACTDTDTTNDAGCDEAGVSSCGIEGIGWMLCPVITFGAGIADAMFGFLAANFLQTDITFLETSGANSGTFTAWGIVRNISNIAFVLVFLIIIFSQLTGLGIANYGIKKMLPRLVIGAILVNVSFFVCQLAVDLSNVLGYSVKNIFDIMGAQVVGGSVGGIANDFASANVDVWGSLVVGLLTAGTVAGVVATASLGGLIAALLAAVIAVAVIFFILIIRQVLIVLLIVLAPLAFVAFLLPNTEKLFDQWRKAFVALLLVFPIVGLVYGASTLASSILKVVYSGTDNTLGQVVAAATLMVPLIAVPFILKKSLDGVGNLGNVINGFGSKVGSSARGAVKEPSENTRLGQFVKYRQGVRQQNRQLTQAGAYKGWNPIRKGLSGVNRGINAVSGKFGTNLAASGVSLATEQLEKETKAAGVLLRSVNDQGTLRKYANDTRDKARHRAAVEKVIATNDVAGYNELLEKSHNWSEEDRIHFADTFAAASNRPGYIGQGTLQEVREGKQQNARKLVRSAVMANAYSPAKMATGDTDELTYVTQQVTAMANAGDNDATLKLYDDANATLNDERLAPTITKNLKQLEWLAGRRAPTPEELNAIK